MAKAKSRANGDGDVFPRKNKAGQITSYRGAYFRQDGKRRYVSGKTKEEARKALREARSNADAGLVFDAGKLTVGEYLDRWLADSVQDTVRQRTYERYESIARVHIKPAIGRLKLKALTPAHARALYRQKLDSGLAPRSVNYMHVNAPQGALAGRERWSGPAQRSQGEGSEAGEAGDQAALIGSGPEAYQDRSRDRRPLRCPLRGGTPHRATGRRDARAPVG
jgi:Phage integrase, N-terminal SAM-like domain